MNSRVNGREKAGDEVRVVRGRVQVVKGLEGHGKDFGFSSG